MQEEKLVDSTVNLPLVDLTPEVEDAPAPELTPEVAPPAEPVVETPEVAPVEATETPVVPKIHAGKVVVSFDGTHAILETLERVPMTQEEYDALS